jgi:hypothetical protein
MRMAVARTANRDGPVARSRPASAVPTSARGPTASVLYLQRTRGNRFVQHWLEAGTVQRKPDCCAAASPDARCAECSEERPNGQQGRAPSTPKRAAEPAVSAQPPAGGAPRVPAGQPAAPAPAAQAGWEGCGDRVASLKSELAQAVNWVSKAITGLGAPDRPAHTNAALRRYLTADPTLVRRTIRPNLDRILTDLNLGAANFRCQTEAQCLAVYPSGANAYAGNPITLCPGYFGKNTLGRVTTLIHEAGHNAGLSGNVVEWEWPFPGLDESTRPENTESYAAFAGSNRYPVLPPFQSDIGVQLSAGRLFAASDLRPRFLVSAELDVVRRQRLFRFFDLHLGTRLDVDASGSVIGTANVGTRLFPPLSVTSTPLFLDLRSGLAVGLLIDAGPRFEDFGGLNVLGVSSDVKVGVLKGHFGGSIGYRRIWKFMKNNPDLNEFTVGGEIRF